GKIMIAAGMAVVYIPLMKLISVWFPKHDFAVLNGIVIAVGNVGAIAASGPLDMLADAIGWRDVFLVLGLVTLALSALCVFIVRDHPSQRGLPSVEEVENRMNGTPVVESSAAKMPVFKGLAVVASGGRRFWCCALAYFLVYGSIMTFQGTWAIKYFDSVYDFAFAASWMVTMVGIGKILSTVAIGTLTSRGILRSKRHTMILGTACFTAVWAVVFLLAGKVDSYWFWFAISFLFGFFGGFMTLSFTQVKEWYPIAISGTAVSGMNIFLFLGASVCTSISSFVIGTTYSLENFSTLWGIMFMFSLVAMVLMVLSKEKGEGDALIGLDKVA
ncbi:MAG: MFS transporter, partial [Candidatus Methanomethylophilaceae archaeon]|nr:MFS transporter [Candidatus Methanomethylophilaceae archaeon]